MSSKAVTEYKGIKYSLQPHGLKSKLWMAFATFVAAFGGALAVASPAEGAATCGAEITTQVIPGSYWWENGAHDGDQDGLGCEGQPGGLDDADTATMLVKGDFVGDFWYVNLDETSRKPVATDSGLVFSPADLIHHTADLPLASLTSGGFVASPDPSPEFDFSVEVRDVSGAYGTLRWDGSQWSITIGSGDGPDGPANAGTHTGADPVALLDGKVTKWGEFDAGTTKVVSFGVGYTQSPPGTVETVVSQVIFGGQAISLVKPAPVPSPSPSPVVVTITRTVTVAVAPSIEPSESPSASPTPGSTSTIPQLIPTSSLSPAAADSDGGSSLAAWGIGVAGVTGVALATMGAIGIIRNRRRQTGRHHADNTKTQLVPVVSGDENAHDISDYGPEAEFDQSLGGRAGDSYWQANADTEPLPEDPDPDRPYGAPW